MPQKHYQAPFDSVAPPRLSSKILQVGATLLSGACLGLLAVSFPKVQDSSLADFTSLVSGPIRHSPMTSIGQRVALASLLGGSWKDVALAAMQASEGCRRDISVRANPQVQAAIANNGLQKQGSAVAARGSGSSNKGENSSENKGENNKREGS